jgi:organic radical activating enzyme
VKHVLSLTGGEPLLQAEFLRGWLPSMRDRWTVLIETAGVRVEDLLLIRDLVDVVSMDMKLPSATGLRPFWDEHERFLAASRGREVVVKAVVTADTVPDDIRRAAGIIAGIDPAIPLIIQPSGGTFAPSAETLLRMQRESLGILDEVRVIPQVHRWLGIP